MYFRFYTRKCIWVRQITVPIDKLCKQPKCKKGTDWNNWSKIETVKSFFCKFVKHATLMGCQLRRMTISKFRDPPWHTRRLAAGRRPENSGRSEPYNNSLIPSQIWKEPPRLHCHSSRTQSALAFLFTCTVVPSKRKSWEHELYHLEAHRSIFP